MFCSIIPPYMLEEVARRGDARLAERARHTLSHDERMRRARARDAVRPEPGRGSGVDDAAPPQRRTASPHAPERTIHDAQNTDSLPGTKVRGEGDPATDDVAVTEAYDGLGHTWQLFYDAYDRSSLDDKGLPLLATVHYEKDYDNAFWDGTQMVFGDGDGVLFNRFTASLDVIGHELAHGVTEHTAGLVYRDQSGALNESMSDVFGSLVRQFSQGQTADQADWLIGAELLADGVKGVALRSMKDPGTAYDDPTLGKDPQPGHMDDFVETSQDNGGVHINSGIPNKAFYLAATTIGGKAWETAGLYWYDALTGDGIRADCDFATFAKLTVDAAQARDGEDAAAKVTQAWEDVGVTPRAKARKRAPGRKKASSGSAVEVERSGGVAGVTRSATIDLTDLEKQEAEAWSNLLTQGRLESLAQELSPPEPRPDGFTYRVRYSEKSLDITVNERDLPTDIRDLVKRHLR